MSVDPARRLQPGDRIGIMGGGQLARMLALAAARLGLDAAIFSPETDSPAARVAADAIVAPYEDLDAVRRFASSCAAVTYEFENVPVETARAAGERAVLRPGAQALEAAQDRLTEKTFLHRAGAATVAFEPVDDAHGAESALDALGGEMILKTRRFGYDGKGQARVSSPAEARAAFEAIGSRPAIAEALAPFERELSVVAARSLDGAVKAFPLAQNRHSDGILRESLAPAAVTPAMEAEALRIATAVLEALDYVGVIAVELFALADGALLVNEIAPRVHNTGHWTMDACACDQFEQHVRAVAGWPLGDPAPQSRARMINLIGEDAAGWARWLETPGARLHLYAKREIRDGRKMGHVNLIAPLGD